MLRRSFRSSSSSISPVALFAFSGIRMDVLCPRRQEGAPTPRTTSWMSLTVFQQQVGVPQCDLLRTCTSLFATTGRCHRATASTCDIRRSWTKPAHVETASFCSLGPQSTPQRHQPSQHHAHCRQHHVWIMHRPGTIPRGT